MQRTAWMRISFDLGHHSTPQNLTQISGSYPQALLPVGVSLPYVGASATVNYATNRYLTGYGTDGQPVYRIDYLTLTQSISAISYNLDFTPEIYGPVYSHDMPYGPNGSPITINNALSYQWFMVTFDDGVAGSYTLPPSLSLPPIPGPPTANDLEKLFANITDVLLKGGDVSEILQKYGPELVAAARGDIDQALKYFQKSLGFYSYLIDVSDCYAKIRDADNPPREFFLQIVDVLAQAAVAGSGTTLGAALLTPFGLTVVGAVVGFASSAILYTQRLDDEIRANAGYWYDRIIEGLSTNVPEPTISPANVQGVDEVWYFNTYPEAATDVAAGLAASAYDHYIGYGADRGYQPSATSPNIPRTQLVVPQHYDVRAGSAVTVVQAPIRIVGSDLASPAELALVTLINQRSATDVDLESSGDLFAVANRLAQNIALSNSASNTGFLGMAGELPPALMLSNGKSIKAMFPDIDLVHARAFMVAGTGLSPSEVMARVLEQPGGEAFLSSGQSVGVAEFSGVWVLIVVGNGDSGEAPQAETLQTVVRLGAAGDETITAGTRAGILSGAGGDDTLVGGALRDVLNGDADNDLLIGGGSADVLDGGSGIDAVSAAEDITGVTIHLAGGWAQDGWGTYDTLSGLENVVGSAFNDTLVGNDVANAINGGAGDDWIVGLGGDDILEGGDGVNVLIGGDGIDLASYASQTANLWIDMPAGVYSASGVWDVFFESIEGVRGGAGHDSIFGNGLANRLEGGGGDDALIGGAGNDTLLGGAGFDWIVGGEGNDRLIGGEGVDVLTGGAGADTFDLGTAAGWDVAFDFSTAEDRFSLGGLSWLGFLTIDADGDGQTDDTLLGYAGGNFVALNASGLSLAQWNALVDAPATASTGAKMIADAESDPLSAWADPSAGGWSDYVPEADHGISGLARDALQIDLHAPDGWGLFA